MKRTTGFWGFLGRFTLLHVVTYVFFGFVFMYISNYAAAFQTPALRDYMRPLDDPILALGIPLQIPRGALLALALFPFRPVIVAGQWGWLKLWGVMWMLMGIGAVVAAPGTLEGLVYTKFGFGNPFVGLPEITCQMLAFSWLLYVWERRIDQRENSAATSIRSTVAHGNG